MKGIIMSRMQTQMVTLSGKLGDGIISEIKKSSMTPYSVLHQRSKLKEAEILKIRKGEKLGTSYIK